MSLSVFGACFLVLFGLFWVDAYLWDRSGGIDCWPNCTTYQQVLGGGFFILGVLSLLALITFIIAFLRRP